MPATQPEEPDGQQPQAAARPPARGRALLLAGGALVAALLTIAALGLVAGRMDTPTADEALIEVKTQNAAAFQETTGPYSRFGWSHPGPILFFAQTPFYVLGGRRPASLYAGAAVLNLVFIALTLRAAWRMGAWSALAGAAAVSLVAWRAQTLLASTWNPHLLLFPWLALVTCGGAWIACGGTRWLTAVVLCATWLAQTHIGAGPGVMLFVAGMALLRPRRMLSREGAVALAVALLLWAPVAADCVLHGRESNPWRVAAWFADDTHGHLGLREAVKAAGESLTAFARPQPVAVPVGWAWRASGRTAQSWAMGCGAALLVVVAVRRARAAAVLAAAVFAGAVYTAWSVRGAMVDHLLFWLGGGVPALFVIAASSGAAVPARFRRVTSAAVVLAFSACAGLALRQLAAEPVRVSPDVSLATRLLVERSGRDLDRAVVDIDDGCWGETAGIVAQLRREHRGTRVPMPLAFMYGRAAAAADERDVLHVFIRREDTPGARRMASEHGRPQLVAGALQMWLVESEGLPARR